MDGYKAVSLALNLKLQRSIIKTPRNKLYSCFSLSIWISKTYYPYWFLSGMRQAVVTCRRGIGEARSLRLVALPHSNQ